MFGTIITPLSFNTEANNRVTALMGGASEVSASPSGVCELSGGRELAAWREEGGANEQLAVTAYNFYLVIVQYLGLAVFPLTLNDHNFFIKHNFLVLFEDLKRA